MIFRISIFLLLFAAGVAATAQEQKLTGDEIIAKHLEAVGGQAALAKIKSRIAIGTIKKESEPEGDMVIMSEVPNRLSFFSRFRNFDLNMIYNGNDTIIRPVLPRNMADITNKYEDMISSGLMFNSISLYNLIGNGSVADLKPEAKGTKKLNGRQTYVVQVKTPKGPMKLYFDAENFMWLRTDYGKASVSSGLRETGGNAGALNNSNNQGGGETTVDFYIETSDFRDVDGIKLPFKFVQVVTYPILIKSSVGTITGTIREYRQNEPIDPKMFQ
jgi:hypothetical protein